MEIQRYKVNTRGKKTSRKKMRRRRSRRRRRRKRKRMKTRRRETRKVGKKWCKKVVNFHQTSVIAFCKCTTLVSQQGPFLSYEYFKVGTFVEVDDGIFIFFF